MLFSNKSSIQQFVVRKYSVRRPIDKRFDPKYVHSRNHEAPTQAN